MPAKGARKSQLQRLIAHSKWNEETGCLEWTGHINNLGYGVFKINDYRIGAHIISLMEAGCDVPPDMWVLHKCDNRKCINPAHLYVGTVKENARDTKERHRARNQWTGKLNGSM